jgi:hypothetical protein
MNLRRAVPALLTWAILSILPSGASPSGFPLPDGKQLEMEVPKNWRSASEVQRPAMTVRLSPKVGESFVVLLTWMPVQPGAPASSPEGLRALVMEKGQQDLASAVQEKIEMVELKGEQGVAYLYHVTDRNPEKGPGDYREATQGAMLLGTYLGTVTILTHTGDSETVEQAKKALASARIIPRP